MEQREYHSQLHCFTWWSPSLKANYSVIVLDWLGDFSLCWVEWQSRSGVSPVEKPNHHCTGVKGVEGHTAWTVCVHNCDYSTEFIIECDLQAYFNSAEMLCMCALTWWKNPHKGYIVCTVLYCTSLYRKVQDDTRGWISDNTELNICFYTSCSFSFCITVNWFNCKLIQLTATFYYLKSLICLCMSLYLILAFFPLFLPSFISNTMVL